MAANKRMFNAAITESDAFLDLPHRSQTLYFHLAMNADDDGFVGSPKRVMRTLSLEESDYAVLLEKRFILSFESGVCVIKHWRINNNKIQTDRYSSTKYTDEKALVILKENGAYTECKQPVNKPLTESIQTVNTLSTKSRVEENRVEKNTLAGKPASVPNKKVPSPKKEKAPVEYYTKERLEEVLTDMEKTPHLDLIATYIREKPVTIENSQQLSLVITRFCKVASEMVGAYSNDQVFTAIDKIKKDNKWKERKGEVVTDWTLETVLKTLVKN